MRQCESVVRVFRKSGLGSIVTRNKVMANDANDPFTGASFVVISRLRGNKGWPDRGPLIDRNTTKSATTRSVRNERQPVFSTPDPRNPGQW